MGTVVKRRRLLAAGLAMAVAMSLLSATPASAVAAGSVSISGPSSANVGTGISFTVSYSCSGDQACANVSINMSYSTMNATGTTSFSIGTLQPGSTGQVFATATFPTSTPNGSTGSATATMNVTNGANDTASTSVQANNPTPPTTTTTTTTTTPGPPTTTTTTTPGPGTTTTTTTGGGPGTTTTTTAPTTTTTPPPVARYATSKGRSTGEIAIGESANWELSTWSWGNLDVTGLGFTDELPPEIVANGFYTGTWSPTSVTATFQYRVGSTWSTIGTFGGGSGAWYGLPAGTNAVRGTYNGGGAVPQSFNVSDPHRVSGVASRPDRNGNWYTTPRSVQNCGQWTSTNAGSGSDCSTINVIVPAARPAPEIWVETGSLKPTSEVSFLVRVANAWDAQLNLIDPFLALHLPDELEYVGWEYVSGGAAPGATVLDGYGGPDRTLVRFNWNQTLVPGDSRDVRVFAKVAMGVPVGNHAVEVLSHTNNTTNLVECSGSAVADGADVDQDGSTSEEVCQSGRWFYVNEAAQTEAVMLVHGEPGLAPLDWATLAAPASPCPDEGGYTFYPCVAQTKSLGQSDYRLEVYNSGNVELTNFTLYNTLPFIGDSGVSPVLAGVARGSEWRPSLQSPLRIVESPPGVVLEYSLETNPCRNELDDGGTWPSGCVDDWGPPPADLRLVQAVRIRGDFGPGQRWQGGDAIIVEYDMDASQGSPFGGEIGWTSFAYRADRADNGLELPASEPRKTGMVIKAPDNGVGTTIWLDLDRDGIREAGEPGLNGFRVELFHSDGTLEAVTFSDNLRGDPTQPGFYFFGDRPPGDYYVQFSPAPIGWNVMLPNQGGDDSVDSDASITTLRTPVFTLGANDFQLSWDLAYFTPLGPLECDPTVDGFDPTAPTADRRGVNDPLECPN